MSEEAFVNGDSDGITIIYWKGTEKVKSEMLYATRFIMLRKYDENGILLSTKSRRTDGGMSPVVYSKEGDVDNRIMYKPFLEGFDKSLAEFRKNKP